MRKPNKIKDNLHKPSKHLNNIIQAISKLLQNFRVLIELLQKSSKLLQNYHFMLSISKSQWVFVDTAQQQHNLNNIVELNTKMTVETLPPPWSIASLGKSLKMKHK